MQFDILVIGAGPGGYIAAIRAAQLGFNTAIIEKYETLGGTCSNVGCIPSKALLDSSELFHNAQQHFEVHGIGTGVLKLDLERMIARKNEVVKQNVEGVAFLMKKNKIQVFHGHGSFKDANTVIIKSDKGEQEVTAGKIIIATGSKPLMPDQFNYDKKRVISSTEALTIEKLPRKMVVVGAGVIGLELGSVFARLGTEIQVVEYLDRALATMDRDCSKEIQRALKKLGIQFHFSHEVTGVDIGKSNVKVNVKKRGNDDSFHLEADYCLVAIGRRPYTDDLGLDNVGIELDEKGRVKVNGDLQTNVENIYAIGDVIHGPMLAHKASEDGVFVVEKLAGQSPVMHYHLVPNVVYTWPEVASVGYSEDQLKEKEIPFKSGKYPVKALGRARASGDLDGMVKVLAHKETDEVLGVHIVSARAADLIMEAAVVMEFKGSAEDIGRICHPHPTYSEAIKEASLAASDDRALNL